MAQVDEARRLIVGRATACAMERESIPLRAALGRRLAVPVVATLDQPMAPVSAMDGYAVRFRDCAPDVSLRVVGQSRAGAPWSGSLGAGEAVRIFTGAVVPEGADHILIQEEAAHEGPDQVRASEPQRAPASIRRKGLDFSVGDTLVPAGRMLTAGALALAAAGNAAIVDVWRKPRIGVLATGDELVQPGAGVRFGQTINSVAPALLALIELWGGAGVELDVARDEIGDVRARLDAARGIDVVVSIGGASVGDYDVVRPAFASAGFDPVFEKVAMKPGKPTWFSASADRLALGLPGNPAAAMVTARLFLRPLIEALTGGALPEQEVMAACETSLPAVAAREDYLRAVLTIGDQAQSRVRPLGDQDSSRLSPFLTANALIRRPPQSAPAAAGDLVPVLML